MRTRRRRRLDVALLAAVVAGVGVAALAGGLAARTERVGRLWAGAEVVPGGAARIVEVIDYDFGIQPRHGIFRDIPGLDPGDPVQVASPTAPAQVEATGTAQQTRLRIGDPDRTISGRHRYTIGYRLGGVAPGGALAWDAVGTSWTVGLGQAELHVVAPYRLEGARCVRGATGSQEACRVDQPEPGHLVATVDGLDAGQGVTLYATAGSRLAAAPALPAPPAGAPDDPGTGLLPPALVAAAAALAGAVPASWLVRRAGRERVARGGAAEAAFAAAGGSPAAGPEIRVDAADLAGLATVEFVPPRELTPAQGGVLLAEAVRPEHQVAWLIGAAVDGYLDLEDSDGQVTLVRRPRRDGPAAYLLDAAFEGRDRLSLGSYDEDFGLAWRSLGRELGAWERASGLWDPAGDRRRGRAAGWASSPGWPGCCWPSRAPSGPAGRGRAGWPWWPPGGCWPGRARPRPCAPGSCGSAPRRGRACGCGPSRSGGSWPAPRPTTPRRRPSAATCASTPPGRSRWASWTGGRGRWPRPRRPPPTRWPPTTR